MTDIAATFARELSAALKSADAPTNPVTDDVSAWLEQFRTALDGVGDAQDDSDSPVKLPAGPDHWLRMACDELDGLPALVSAIHAAAKGARWYQIYTVDEDPTEASDNPMRDLASGMYAAQMIGPRGLIKSTELLAGLFLLRPRLHYPLHQHQATEIYFGASGTVQIQQGLGQVEGTLGPGQVSLTPSNRLHALTMGDSPVLLLYTWMGELGGRNWWWHPSGEGVWQRDAWERQPNAAWAKTVTEVLSPEHTGIEAGIDVGRDLR
ncbi:MAG: dimethylsulfonioproprionate lyase family protein [Arenicellales bacterium]|nr:dimethylsulfonioproprionate lyase family protein [Arenicellales bacterium]